MKKLIHKLDPTHSFQIVQWMQVWYNCTICFISLNFQMILDFSLANYSKCQLKLCINTIYSNEEIRWKHKCPVYAIWISFHVVFYVFFDEWPLKSSYRIYMYNILVFNTRCNRSDLVHADNELALKWGSGQMKWKLTVDHVTIDTAICDES